METSISGFLTLTSLLLATVAFVFYLYLKYVVYNVWARNGVAHDKPSIPLGNIPISYFKGDSLHGTIVTESYKKFKKFRVSGLYLLWEPILMINDPELIRLVMVKNFTQFYNRGRSVDDHKDSISASLDRLTDEKWKRVRGKLSPAFTSGKLKLMYPLIEEIGHELINAIDRALLESPEIEVKEILTRYTVDCITSIAFGFNADSLHNSDSIFLEYGKSASYLGRFYIIASFYIPQLFKFIPVPAKRKRNGAFFIDFFRKIVEQRRKDNSTKNDFLSMLIELMDHGKIREDDGSELHLKTTEADRLTMTEALSQVFIFFTTGQETTSTLLTCCIYELAMHQDVQQNLFDEIQDVNNGPGGLTYEKLNKMQYLDMVFQESLRKYPSSALVGRICTEDFEIPDMKLTIKKGMRIFIPYGGLHADPDYFPEPQKFDPTRFLPDNIAKRKNFTFLPFGEGPRQCIAKRLAVLKAKMALYHLLLNYKFLPSEKTPKVIKILPDYSVNVPASVFLNVEKRTLQRNIPESSSAAELKIASCEALSRFPINEAARRLLIHVKVTEALYNLITGSEALPVRSAATRLLLLFCADPILARLCVQQGHLFYMLKNRGVSRAIPEWSCCVEALFGADLPMKFAYTGRLSLRDVSQDGFYVMRRSSCPFPVLEELFRLKLCPLEPIYVANFSETHEYDDDEDSDYLAGKQAAFDAAREAIRRESWERGIRVSEGTINAWLELKFGRLQPDPDLVRYLRLLKADLAAEEEDEICPANLIKVSSIASRTRIVGRFVARQLSGMDPSSVSCTNQQLELHLRAIREKIETSVIPLGMLRFGSYLERALLFKVLADRIALPASLVRGSYGTSWIEIAVPVITASKSSAPLPRDYLRENFIVDLMNEPGELMAIDSVGARRYIDRQSSCERIGCCG